VIPDPGGRSPAPGPLRAVQLFVNTLDIENGVDELSGPAALAEVLAAAGLAEGDLQPTDADVRTALDVREALRALLLANNGSPAEPAQLVALEQVSIQVSAGSPYLSRVPQKTGG
jgi:hypothetical protein